MLRFYERIPDKLLLYPQTSDSVSGLIDWKRYRFCRTGVEVHFRRFLTDGTLCCLLATDRVLKPSEIG
jgi:hypothetical protein